MYLLLRYPDGEVVEAVVLSARPNHMRVAMRGYQDSISLDYDGWYWRHGPVCVEFDFMTSASEHDVPCIAAPLLARAAS